MGYLRLIRIGDCLLATAAVWVGAWMTWLSPEYFAPLMISLAACSVTAAGSLFDRAINPRDPDSPRDLHRNLSIGLALLSIVLGLLVSLWLAAGALIASALLAWYYLRLKEVPLVGNFTIALLVGALFVAGGYSVDTALVWQLPGVLIPAVFAFLFYFVREIINDAIGAQFSTARDDHSIARRLGPTRAVGLALALFFVFVLLTYWPILAGWFGSGYRVVAVYLIDLPLLGLLIVLWGNPSRRMLAVTASSLKAGMALGLVALLLA